MADFKIGDRVHLKDSKEVDTATVSPMIDGEIVDENISEEGYWFVTFDLEYRDRVETVAAWCYSSELELI